MSKIRNYIDHGQQVIQQISPITPARIHTIILHDHYYQLQSLISLVEKD